jgi:hypothetical protein
MVPVRVLPGDRHQPKRVIDISRTSHRPSPGYVLTPSIHSTGTSFTPSRHS